VTRIKVDPHVHTRYSGHSTITCERLEARARKFDIDCIGLTDHDSIEGAFELRDRGHIKTIVGEEITTTKGEIIGLFLTKPIDKRPIKPRECLNAIKDQGGLSMVPHPFDHLRKRSLNLVDIILEADILEVFNSRTLYKKDNEKAEALAEEHGLVRAIGSDAHLLMEIGNAYMEMADFKGPEDFMKGLRSKSIKFHKKTAGITVHGITKVLKKMHGYGKGRR